ncbi:MAG: type pilus assembly protein PilQ [Verrucomicrobiota bacterium]|jgi:type IV pilus secretin PilQ/predicted competence protein
MFNRFKPFICGTAALLGAITLSEAQIGSPTPAPKSLTTGTLQTAPAVDPQAKTPTSPALPAVPSTKVSDNSPLTLVQASTTNVAPPPTTTTTTKSTATTTDPSEADTATDNGGVGVREFQGDDVGQVLRLLARQAKINMVVSEAVVGTVTMRLEDVTALQAIAIIVKAKGLFMDKIDNVYYIKTATERTAEPTESDNYQFSYARAKDVAVLIAPQLSSKEAAQVDERTNTLFFRETRSNIDNIRKLLAQVDRPTKQVMIEARLVEVTANPKQAYGINWGGVLGGATNPQTIKFAGSNPAAPPTVTIDNAGVPHEVPGLPAQGKFDPATGKLIGADFFFNKGLGAIGQQFAILSAPQMSVTIQALNEDSDAEFLANPRVVTADNMQAKIEIIRNQPVPKLNFNEQTATAVFGGFEDKKFGNTLLVKPSINKDSFITLAVRPEISNKVGDSQFVFAGATVFSPIIDTRSLDSNVLIKSGDTLAIGGLLQDEVVKSRTKVPIMGDVPVLGYLFQSRSNIRTKRNLLVFVTPTIIDQRYGTGLEDQVSGVHHSGEEFADPNGWRNNAKGAVRLVPTSHRQNAADYPKPGAPPAPAKGSTTTTTTTTSATEKVQFLSTAKDRDF